MSKERKQICIIEDEPDAFQKHKDAAEKKFGEKYDLSFMHIRELNDVPTIIYDGIDLYIVDGDIVGGHTKTILDTLPKDKTFVSSNEADYRTHATSLGYNASDKGFWHFDEEVEIIANILQNNTN